MRGGGRGNGVVGGGNGIVWGGREGGREGIIHVHLQIQQCN